MNSYQVEIKNEKLKAIVYRKLGKIENEILTKEDISKITELSLNINEIGENIIVGELALFSGINSLNLRGFNIGIREAESLNKLPELRVLQLCDSNVDFNDVKLEKSISELDLINCTGITIEDFKRLSKLSTIRMINCKDANLEGIGDIPELKELYIHNQQLDSANELSKAIKLELLDLAGTKVKDDTRLKDISAEIKNYNEDYCLGEENWNIKSETKRKISIRELESISEKELDKLKSEDITISKEDFSLLNTEKGKKLLDRIKKQGNKIHLYLNNTAELNEKELNLLSKIINIDKVHIQTGWDKCQDRGYDIETYKAIKAKIQELISRDKS